MPAHRGPDYLGNLYPGSKRDEKGVYSYHTSKYGPLKEFGYKDFIPMFTAPKFNADQWVGLMHEAGAKFGGICLVHHDGFLLWDSKVNRWNSANMGPKRDIYGEIAAAVRKYDDMRLLATFHHARSFGYCTGSMKEADVTDEMRKTWDVFDPQYADFYWQNFEHHHWGLGLLTPATVHHAQADAALAARQAVLDATYAAHPERFVRQPPQPLKLPTEVWINPPADGPEPRTLELPLYTDFDEELSQTR